MPFSTSCLPAVRRAFFLATVAVLVACDGATGPEPVGEVRGIVAVDGVGVQDVGVELSGAGRRQVATDENGRFTFSQVAPGAYVVTVVEAPADIAFAATSRAAVIGREPGRQSETVDFTGSWIRTSTIRGRITSRNRPLSNVAVRIEGPDVVLDVSDAEGRFSATGLRRGTYDVTISGFPPTVQFPVTRREVEVEMGAVATADFEGDRELTATLVITGLTRNDAAGGVETVDPANVRGPIDVHIRVDRGQDTPESVGLYLDGERVGLQLFNPPGVGASVARGESGTDVGGDDGVELVDAAGTEAAGAPGAAVEPDLGGRAAAEDDDVEPPAALELSFSLDTRAFEPATGTPRFPNGAASLEARLATREGGEDVWASTLAVTLRNPPHFGARLEAERGPVAGADGRDWVAGDLDVTVFPVVYDEGRTVTGVTVDLRREGGATIREATATGEGPWGIAFPQSGEGGLAGYQTPRGASDVVRVRSAVFSDGSQLEAPVTVVPSLHVDNVAPPGGDFGLPPQSAAYDCCLANWVGPGFAFAAGFSGTGDAGVGDGAVTFHVGAAGLPDEEIVATPPVTSVEGLPESGTNSAYRAVARFPDLLGNARLVALAPSSGNSLANAHGAVFGVDRTPPVLSYSSSSVAHRAVNPPSGSEWVLQPNDDRSGFSTTPARTSVRRLDPEGGGGDCLFPAGDSACEPAPDGLSRAVPSSGAAGYVVHRARVLDRAGNASGEVSRWILLDLTAPAVEEIDRPPSPDAGAPVTVRAPLRDDVDLHRAVARLRFAAGGGLPEARLGFQPADTVGVRFDGSPVPWALAEWSVPVVGALERASAGSGGDAPSGVLRSLAGVRVSAADAAGNEGSLERAMSAGGAAPLGFSVDARGEEQGVRGWRLVAEGSSVCAPSSGMEGGGSCGSAPAVLELSATARGPGSTFDAPFAAVHFYALVDGTARWLGATASGALTQDGSGAEGRHWTWTFGWRPEADFPSGDHLLFAVGVDDAGNALETLEVGPVSVVSGG